MRSFRVLPLLGLLVLGAVAPLSAQSSPADGNGPVLQAGDMVRITVWRRPELSGEFQVAANGSLTHPLYREVRVTGVSLPTVEERLQSFLGRLESNPQIAVEPLLRVAVGGEVRTPNLYTLPPETTISQAVALAGGMTERGRLDRVQLVRGGQVTRLDLTAPDAGLAHMTVRSGDQIVVDRRTSFLREYIVPTTSIIAAIAAVLNYATR